VSQGSASFLELAASVGLSQGRLLSMSKSAYLADYPDHLVVFNAGICHPDGLLLWNGDLDLTIDEPTLRDLAVLAGFDLSVLYEGGTWAADFRLCDPGLAVVRVTAADHVSPATDRGRDLLRDESGRLVRRRPTP
jgi:hypothetical protein